MIDEEHLIQVEQYEKNKQVTILENAKTFSIVNAGDYNIAKDLRKQIKELKKEIKASFKEQKDFTHKAHKAVIRAENEHLYPLDRSDGILNQKMVEWTDSKLFDPDTDIKSREHWTFEVKDPEIVPRKYLMIDEKKIGGVVRALKSQTNIAGILPVCKTILLG